MIYNYRIRPIDLEDDILSAFLPQLPRCIVYSRSGQLAARGPNVARHIVFSISRKHSGKIFKPNIFSSLSQ